MVKTNGYTRIHFHIPPALKPRLEKYVEDKYQGMRGSYAMVFKIALSNFLKKEGY